MLIGFPRNPHRIVVALTEEIRVPRWTVRLFCPQLEEQRTLEYEDSFVFGSGKPIQYALKRILREQQSEVFLLLACAIQQPLPDRCGDIGSGFAQWSDSM
jgi:hypothetical protein